MWDCFLITSFLRVPTLQLVKYHSKQNCFTLCSNIFYLCFDSYFLTLISTGYRPNIFHCSLFICGFPFSILNMLTPAGKGMNTAGLSDAATKM